MSWQSSRRRFLKGAAVSSMALGSASLSGNPLQHCASFAKSTPKAIGHIHRQHKHSIRIASARGCRPGIFVGSTRRAGILF